MNPETQAASAEDRRYRDLIERVRARVGEHIPPGASVLVISHGDESFVRIEGRHAGHYPQSSTGFYAGYYPGDGAEARAHLAALRDRGAEYLVVPETSSWWLGHYAELAELLAEGELILDEPETCRIYALRPRVQAPEPLSPPALAAVRVAPQVEALISALLPEDAAVLVVGPGASAVEPTAHRTWTIDSEREQPWSAEEAEAELAQARAAGATHLVLVKPADRRRLADSRITARLTASARPVFAQGLADGFELSRG